MALPNYLSKIKSAGIYRFTWDKSEIPVEEAETLRLVVGYSEMGPFNTPVLVKGPDEFKAIFGNVNKKLERNGVWFHRLALQALEAGPIFCLNLKKFNTSPGSPEEVTAINFDPQNIITTDTLGIEDIFNTTRFWRLDPLTMQDAAETAFQSYKYITIAATDTKSASSTVFIRGYEPRGYDVTFQEWFTNVMNGAEIPSYLEGYEQNLLSQYFAQVVVFKGEFTPALAQTEAFSRYFDVNGATVTLKDYVLNAFGERIDTLDALTQDSNSNYINTYVGIVLPDFVNGNGINISLDSSFNANNQYHHLMMNFDQDKLYSGDISTSDLDTTGWSGVATYLTSLTPISVMSSTTGIIPSSLTMEYNIANQAWEEDSANSTPSPLNGPDITLFTKAYNTTGVIDVGTAGTDFTLSNNKLDFSVPQEIPAGVAENVVISYTDAGITYYAKVDEVDSGLYTVDVIDVTSNIEINVSGNEITFTNAIPSSIQIGSKILNGNNNIVTVTNINNSTKKVTTSETFTLPSVGDLFDEGAIGFCLVQLNNSVTHTSQNMVPTYMEGYNYANTKPTTNTQADRLLWVNSHIDVLTAYEGIRTALTGNVDIEFHYLVDTFESYVEPNCKAKLATIAKMKDNCLAIINFPAMRTFQKCVDASFTDSNDRFQVKYIRDGYNRQKPATTYFSLPKEADGASWSAYYTAVVINNPINSVKTTVPSAALVSNNFMVKYVTRQPYSIVAGPNYGVLSTYGLTGPEFNFSRDDLDILEPMGVNANIYIPRKGTIINSNVTAKQNPKTTLSYINVRELVTYLQNEIHNLLQTYQWEFNTPELRATVKDKADVILMRAAKNGGVKRYLNICDETNNTDDVINNEMLVLSTSIEPGLGAGKMVQELTLYRQGGMSSIITEA